MFEELDLLATGGVSDAATTSLVVDCMIIANRFANREYGSADSHMIKFNRDLLIVYLTIGTDRAELLENATTGCLANHRSFFGVVLADFVIRKFNIGVNGMYKAARVDHAQDLIRCYLDFRQLLHCLRQTFLVSRHSSHNVASCIGILAIAYNDGIVFLLLPAFDPLSCGVCFLRAARLHNLPGLDVHLVRPTG